MARREGVLYARLGLQLVHHHKAIQAGEEAMGLYTYLILYSRLEELDGFVPKAVAELGWTGDTKRNRRRLETLVSVRLIEQKSDGFLVSNYADFNETRESVAERRREVRERVTRYRAVTSTVTDTPCNAFVPVSVSVSDPESKEDPERLAAPPANDVPRPLGPSVGAQSAPPDDVPLDDDLKARCFAAGVRHPTKQDVQAMLNHARDKGRTSADWKAALVQWVRRKPQFEGPRSPQDASSASGRPERPPQGMSPPVPRSVPAPWSKKKEAS